MMLQDPPIGRARHPQTHHGEVLEPQQLSRLLDWLMQASPAILVRPQAAASSLVAGATRKDGEMMQWLCQTVLSRDGTSRSALWFTSMLDTGRHPQSPVCRSRFLGEMLSRRHHSSGRLHQQVFQCLQGLQVHNHIH